LVSQGADYFSGVFPKRPSMFYHPNMVNKWVRSLYAIIATSADLMAG
jgi:hypothetical protein